MRIADFKDYFKLRWVAANAWQFIRFRIAKRPGQVFEIHLWDGHRLYVRAGRRDARLFCREYTRDDYRVADHSETPWNCVVDLGANVGFFASHAASFARTVICYEPIAENFAQLQKNCEGWPNIVPVCAAVNGKRGIIRIYHPEDPRVNTKYSKYRETDVRLSEKYSEVPAIALDDLIEEHRIDVCDLLKIDVEGAEYDILYATSDETFSRIRRIHGEYHSIRPGGPCMTGIALADFLRSKGFRVEVRAYPTEENRGLFYALRE
jgi:FkbM family methyltransferase